MNITPEMIAEVQRLALLRQYAVIYPSTLQGGWDFEYEDDLGEALFIAGPDGAVIRLPDGEVIT